MAVTQQQIDQLEAAIFSGEKSAAYDGRTVVYRSLEEMRSLLADMKAALAGSTLTYPEQMARRRTVAAHDMDRGGPIAGDSRLDWH
jgi:hypothetical protein